MRNPKPSPIALFVYNRPEHTKKTVEALKKNPETKNSVLYVFSDAPKKEKDKEPVKKVRNYIKKIKGFKQVKVIERKENYGLAKSIIQGVTQIVNKHGKIIVLEDDLIVSPYFLKYMNDSLELYKNEKKVGAISGYFYNIQKKLPETFFLHFFGCWGWATWKDRWDLFEKNGEKLIKGIKEKNLKKLFNINNTYSFTRMLRNQIKGLNNSWAIRFYSSLLNNKKLVLYPGKSLVKNIGFDDTGTHGQKRDIFESETTQKPIKVKKIPIKQSPTAYKELQKYFKSVFWERVFNKFKRFFKRPLNELKNI